MMRMKMSKISKEIWFMNHNSGGNLMDRFKKTYVQGSLEVFEIWVDTETGVNYIFHRNGNAAGFTPLLDENGQPVVTPDFE